MIALRAAALSRLFDIIENLDGDDTSPDAFYRTGGDGQPTTAERGFQLLQQTAVPVSTRGAGEPKEAPRAPLTNQEFITAVQTPGAFRRALAGRVRLLRGPGNRDPLRTSVGARKRPVAHALLDEPKRGATRPPADASRKSGSAGLWQLSRPSVWQNYGLLPQDPSNRARPAHQHHAATNDRPTRSRTRQRAPPRPPFASRRRQHQRGVEPELGANSEQADMPTPVCVPAEAATAQRGAGT